MPTYKRLIQRLLTLYSLFTFTGVVFGMDINYSVNHMNPMVENFLDHVAHDRHKQVGLFIQNKLVNLHSLYTISEIFNNRISLGAYALGESIRKGKNKVSRELIRYIDIENNTIPIDGFDELGTPLTAAVYNNDSQLAEFLLNLGADIDGDSLFTPLHAAVDRENPSASIVQLLIENRANLNIRRKLDEHFPTALEIAASIGDSQVVKILLDHLASVDLGVMSEDLRNKNVRPAIVHAASSRENSRVSLKAFKMLLIEGADVNAVDFDDTTALQIGVENNDSELIQLLCELRGSDIHYTVLLEGLNLAARDGKKQIVDLLCRHDADINGHKTIDRDGIIVEYSPLVTAANHGKTEIVRYLLSRGAAPQEASKFSPQGENLIRQNHKFLDKHIRATKKYLEKEIGPRDIHVIVFGMLYGKEIASREGKKIQQYRNRSKSDRPYKRLKHVHSPN